MTTPTETKNHLFAAQANLDGAIKRALQEYHEQTGIFVKGHFGFYLSGGYGDKPPMPIVDLRTQMTFDPERYEFITPKLK